MIEHPNVTLLRNGYRAFAEGDMARMAEFMAEDVVWHEGGHHPLSGDYKGREAVIEFLERIEKETDRFEMDIHDVMATEEHGVALVRRTGSRRGRHQEMNFAHVFHLADGKFAEFWSLAEDQAAVDAFWS